MIGVGLGVTAPRPPRIAAALDTFSRANSTTGLGTSESGQVWANASGVFGIADGQAYVPTSTGFVLALLTGGALSGDVDLSADVLFKTSNFPGICIRAASASNRIAIALHNTAVNISRVVTGTNTTVGTGSFAPVDGQTYRLRVIARGSQITAMVDGVVVASATESTHAAQTGIGLESFRSDATPLTRWDNLAAYAA